MGHWYTMSIALPLPTTLVIQTGSESKHERSDANYNYCVLTKEARNLLPC